MSGNKRKDSDSSSRGRMGRYDDKNIIVIIIITTPFIIIIIVIVIIIIIVFIMIIIMMWFDSPSGKSHDSSDSEHSWGRGREELQNR